MCSSATGSSPKPLSSYSNTSLVEGFYKTNLASEFYTHIGLNVNGNIPVDFFFT